MIEERIIKIERLGDNCICYDTEFVGEIIRCRECKHCYRTKYGNEKLWCDRVTGAVFDVEEDGYCAWAVRKEQSE